MRSSRRFMIFVRAAALAALVVVAFAACAGGEETETSEANSEPRNTRSKLDRILEEGVIRVGTPGDFNPMTFVNPDTGEYEGYYIDVAKDLAADMGVEVEWVATTWRDIVSGIAADRYDIATGASYNMGRATQGAFTHPIAQVGTVPLMLEANADRFDSWESINQEGVKVAVTLGTVFDEQAQLFFPNAEIVAVESPARDFQEVLAGRADVSITSNIEAGSLIETYPEMMIVPIDAPRNNNANGMIVPRGDQVFLNYVNTWITMRDYAGYFDELSEEWGLVSF